MASQLTIKSSDITRSAVQKAVVVLARQPVFGPVRQKLGIVTGAYFAQTDLSDTSILGDFYETLETGLRQGLGTSMPPSANTEGGVADDDDAAELSIATADSASALGMGTSLRELLYDWRGKLLVLLKLILLQKRVMLHGYPIERLCTYEYSIVSLVPGILAQGGLQDAASALLHGTDDRLRAKAARQRTRNPPSSAKSSTQEESEPGWTTVAKPDSSNNVSSGPPDADLELRRTSEEALKSLARYPFPLFGEGALFQPYIPLQEIDTLSAGHWLVGTSNSVFRSQSDVSIDAFVDLQQRTIEFPTHKQGEKNKVPGKDQPPLSPSDLQSISGPRLSQIVALTPSDRKWMDEVIGAVVDTWDPSNPSRPTTLSFRGSDDWIRYQFETYVANLLGALKVAHHTPIPPTPLQELEEEHGSQLTEDGKAVPRSINVPHPDPYTLLPTFGRDFVAALTSTPAFGVWDECSSAALPQLPDGGVDVSSLASTGHPCDGPVSLLQDVGLRMSQGLHDWGLDSHLRNANEQLRGQYQQWQVNERVTALNKNLEPTKEALGKSLSAGYAGLSRFADRARSDLGERWASYQQNQAPGAAAKDVDAPRPSADSAAAQSNPVSWQVPPQLGQQASEAASAASAAAAQAATQARSALNNFGSFLSAKQRGWNSKG